MNKYLIAGLGNPGAEYEGTRHNIGFAVADALVAAEGGKFTSGRYADRAEFRFKGRQVIVIKPNTYMNLSGKAIAYWLQQEHISVENMMVVVDELALPLGKLRLGPKGSDGGHNGLKSIQESIGTTVYPRLRFGIGNGFSKGGQVDFVLGGWKPEEEALLKERIRLACDALRGFVFTGLELAMTNFNGK